MREDMNKLLCERSRFESRNKYGNYRQMKEFTFVRYDDDECEALPSHEGMKSRHNTRSFNENLGPLKKYLHSKVGQKWDDIYSEICSRFDKRKVINQHILQHIFVWVEIGCKMIDGKVMHLYGRGFSPMTDGYQPVEHCQYITYYVHPETGILTKNETISYRQRRRTEHKKEQEEFKRSYKKISPTKFAMRIGEIWYMFILNEVPPPRWRTYPTPNADGTYKKYLEPTPYRDELRVAVLDYKFPNSAAYKKAYDTNDYYHTESNFNFGIYNPREKYANNKKTLSHKEKRKYGIIK